MSKLTFMALAATFFTAAPALAGSCPAPLGEALRLVMVTTASMNSSEARLQLFVRPDTNAPWKAISRAERAVVGKQGLAWGYTFLPFRRGSEPDKREGDRRTPAGVFRLGPSFGFDGSARPRHILVKANETICVEDPASPLYNQITQRAKLGPGIKADNMRDTALFRNGLFVDYPTDARSRRGSCIFVHIWKGPDVGTMGCVAMPEERVQGLQDFAEAGAVLAVLPRTALDRFSGCLPKF